MNFNETLSRLSSFLWGTPLVTLILVTGIWLTLRLRFIQVFHLKKALKFMVTNEKGGRGEVSSFGALCTALSATIGTGNIVGVATALCAGGPGALFWMWIAAFFSMATKYAEGFLAVKYRQFDKKGNVLGGPFYYIEKGMGKEWRWLALLFAFFGAAAGVMGIGTITQVNGITSAVSDFFDPSATNCITLFGNNYTYATVVSGLITGVLSGVVIIGGIKRISKVASVVVPFMAVLYISFTVLVLIYNFEKIPGAITTVITCAFNPRAAAGGIYGITLKEVVSKGVSRGIFTNEAGLGSAPIAAAAAQTKDKVRQGLVTMTGTFIDTIVMCTMTGLAVVIANACDPAIGLEGAAVTSYAYRTCLPFKPEISAFVLMLSLVFFAFSTIIGWNYYGEKCLEYLAGRNKRKVMMYRVLYILSVFAGPYLTVNSAFNLADVFNALMALPNLVALLALSSEVATETKKYFERSF